MTLIGFLSIDKPLYITSHDVVQQIRRLTKQRRVGHAGTLDPLATGVLIVGVGRATRFIEYAQGQPKSYEATLRLGQTTNTYDAEGDITSETAVTTSQTQFLAALPPFRGQIQQQPPMFSAIKRQGQPLYKLARQGIEVERAFRTINISELTLTAWNPPYATLQINCSTGTYIRSLAHDIGQALGCGAHLTALRRTAIGAFTSQTAVPLDQLTPDNVATHLLPPDAAVQQLPSLTLNEALIRAIQYGQTIPQTTATPPGTLSRVYTTDNTFIGLLIAKESHWQPHKILVAA